jgi:hypothetical protein
MKILYGIVFFIFISFPICHSQVKSNDTVGLLNFRQKEYYLIKVGSFMLAMILHGQNQFSITGIGNPSILRLIFIREANKY